MRPSAFPNRAAGGQWLVELDGLRALAALSVVFVHYNPAPLTPSETSIYGLLGALHRLAFANLGVIFFYTLSAFLLTFLGVREHDSTGTFAISPFYVRRCLRIWPLYFTAVAVALLLAARGAPLEASAGVAGGAQWVWLKAHTWMFMTFLSNWSLALNYMGSHVDQSTAPLAILWSVAVEEQFYLLYPVLLWVVLRSRRSLVAVASVLALAGLSFRFLFRLVPVDNGSMGPSGGMYYATLTYADVFLMGSAAGWAVARGFHRRGALHAALTSRATGLLLAGGVVALGLLIAPQLWYPYAAHSVVVYPLAGILFAMILLWTVVNRHSWLCRLLRGKVMATLGGLTFGMYMCHPFVGPMVRQIPSLLPLASQRDVNVVDALEFVVYVAGTIGGAALAHGLVEQPFLRLKTKYAQGTRKTADRTRTPVVPWAYVFVGCSSGALAMVYGARLAFAMLP